MDSCFLSARCCFDLTRAHSSRRLADGGIRFADRSFRFPPAPTLLQWHVAAKKGMQHDLSGLECAIYLKSELLRTLAATAPDDWPNHVAKFMARLEASNLHDATALAVLLADLRTQIRIVANVIGDAVGEAAIDEPALTSMSQHEVLEWFRAEMLTIISRAARRDGPRSAVVEQVVQFIDHHYAESVTIGAIARSLDLSRRQLAAAFRREMEQTINEYLTHVRMRHAVELIKQGCKIEVVSLMVGYRSRKNFYHHFKAVVGMTPHAYQLTAPRER